MPVKQAQRRSATQAARPKPAPVVKAAPKPTEAVEIIDDVVQGSPEWFALRLGLPTASRFATIMASGKDGGESVTRRKLLYALAGEKLTEQPAEHYRNDAMDRGTEMQAEALEWYARTNFVDLREVGFIKREVVPPLGKPYIVGCSPDALIVGKSKAVEVKTERPDLLIERALKGAQGFPPEHRAQCQGTLWVAGLEDIDLIIFHRGMPLTLTFPVHRDEAYIKRIADEVERFNYELDQLVAKIRSMGRV